MDLNEAEDEFRQQLYDDINQTVENNSIAGNAYYSLENVIAKAVILVAILVYLVDLELNKNIKNLMKPLMLVY